MVYEEASATSEEMALEALVNKFDLDDKYSGL